MTDNGRELSFVQRAKGLGIAPDCMAIPGGTPPFKEDFLKQDFDFSRFYMGELEEELLKEYGLNPSEFNLEEIYLVDDANTIPAMVTRIKTSLPAKAVTERIYGKERAISEHQILYAVDVKGIGNFLERFSMFLPSAFIVDVFDKDNS